MKIDSINTGWALRLVPGLLLLLVGCTTPAQRIEGELVTIGVPPPQARCVGERLADRLSHDQLRRLGEIAQAAKGQGADGQGGAIALDRLVRQFNHPGDSKLIGEVLRAGISCAI